MLVEGKQKLDFGKKRIEFGAYTMVYMGTKGNMKKRSVPAIALKASNEEGEYFLMSLYTGKRLHSYIWEEIPIDQDTIDRVDQLEREEKQPVLDNNQPLFEWLPGKEIEDHQHDPIIQEEE